MTTTRTQFGRGIELIQFSIISPIPVGLVFQFPENLAKGRICYMLGQLAILQHPGDVQSFNIDRLVLADDLGREFLNRISTAVADSGMELGYYEPGFLSIVAPL